MEPTLHNILKDGVTKYLEVKEQTKYNVSNKPPNDYWKQARNLRGNAPTINEVEDTNANDYW